MLHHDAVYCPTDAQMGAGSSKAAGGQKAVANQAAHLTYLDKNPFTEVDQDDMEKVMREGG